MGEAHVCPSLPTVHPAVELTHFWQQWVWRKQMTGESEVERSSEDRTCFVENSRLNDQCFVFWRVVRVCLLRSCLTQLESLKVTLTSSSFQQRIRVLRLEHLNTAPNPRPHTSEAPQHAQELCRYCGHFSKVGIFMKSCD